MSSILKIAIPFVVGFILFQIMYRSILSPKLEPEVKNITECKADSLLSVVDSLQRIIRVEREESDVTEKKYLSEIGSYKFGLDYLNSYHRDAYRDFVRVCEFKEDYTNKVEKDFKERLGIK